MSRTVLAAVLLLAAVNSSGADGGSAYPVCFDALKQDAGYAAGIESRSEQPLSSHAAGRFLRAFHLISSCVQRDAPTACSHSTSSRAGMSAVATN